MYLSYLQKKQLKKHQIIHLIENGKADEDAWIFTLGTNNPDYLLVVLEPKRPDENKSTHLYYVEVNQITSFRCSLKKAFEHYMDRRKFRTKGLHGCVQTKTVAHNSIWVEIMTLAYEADLFIY